ncbi:MAG: hypothetical protein KCHDKBKB_00030 [Elusimicrobia bacterium]|nr:hypothetical protein [Elusimicrobiota bacterium]
MKKSFWGGIMLLSLLAIIASGYYFVTKLPIVQHPSSQEKPIETPPVTETPAKTESPETPLPPTSPEIPAQDSLPESPTRNILFRFPRPSAKSVHIVGDFNDWKRQSLEKKEKGWEITLSLKPGPYVYLYVVDGKRIKDPNNKYTKEGKSLITVKPLTP